MKPPRLGGGIFLSYWTIKTNGGNKTIVSVSVSVCVCVCECVCVCVCIYIYI